MAETQVMTDAWARLTDAPRAEFLVTPDLALKRGDLLDLVPRICGVFDSAGLSTGDRVLIRTSDESAAILGFVTCLLDGLVPVMLTADTPDERCAFIQQSVEAGITLMDRDRAGAEWCASVPVLSVGGSAGKQGLLGLRRPRVVDAIAARMDLPNTGRKPRLPSDGADLAYILFTSGTTSDPAGVMISRGAMAANVATIARVLDIDGQSRIFNDMILAHADGLIQGPVMALLTGAASIRAGGFALSDLEDWLDQVRARRASHFLTVPTIWAMIDRYAAHDDYFDAPEMGHLVTVAAAMPEDLWQRIETRFRRPLTNQYGLTETVASALYAGPSTLAGAPFSIGVPVDCDAKIATLNGQAQDEGELLLRGTNILTGYWKNPERTDRTLTEDGWLKTGDLARLGPDGSYQITGRLKTAIMSGGFLIRPEEIDDVLRGHPAVAEVTTVGLPHLEFGEIAVSAVVCLEACDEESLTAYLRLKLEPQKVPRRIIAVDAIPRGDAGKPKLDAVRSLLAQKIEPQASASEATSIELDVLATAAIVFRVKPDTLSLSFGPDQVAAWDSFTHVELILALEDRFDLRISPRRAASIRTIDGAAAAVRDAQG